MRATVNGITIPENGRGITKIASPSFKVARRAGLMAGSRSPGRARTFTSLRLRRGRCPGLLTFPAVDAAGSELRSWVIVGGG
jgi:hypothetical protein